MTDLFVPVLAQSEMTPGYLVTQIFNGLVNGCFYALFECECEASPLPRSGRVVGLDFADNMLERARAKAVERLELVEFVQGDALALPFADDVFDGATVAFGIRNVADLGRGIAEMARVVRPGGRVVILEITTPRRLRR